VILAQTVPTILATRLRSGRSKRAGLSLIEVLLALGIFTMSLVAIARLVDMGTDRQIESQFQIRGARLAQSKMGEIISGSLGSLGSLSSSSGTFDNDTEWSWNMSATTPPQTSAPNLYLVTVTVSRDNRGQKFQLIVAQMAIDPLYMGSGQPATSTTDAGSATSAIYGNGSAGGGTP
jgi:general secretion pathway protein I